MTTKKWLELKGVLFIIESPLFQVDKNTASPCMHLPLPVEPWPVCVYKELQKSLSCSKTCKKRELF